MEGSIMSARVDGVEYIRFMGVIRYSQCAGLESHIEKLFVEPRFSEIAIDLEKTGMLDSTALGLLARIAIEFKKMSDNRPVIFLRHGELAHILKRVCFDQVFNIVTQPKSNDDMNFVEISSVSNNEENILKCVIEAHKSLAEISEENNHYFTDITQALN